MFLPGIRIDGVVEATRNLIRCKLHVPQSDTGVTTSSDARFQHILSHHTCRSSGPSHDHTERDCRLLSSSIAKSSRTGCPSQCQTWTGTVKVCGRRINRMNVPVSPHTPFREQSFPDFAWHEPDSVNGGVKTRHSTSYTTRISTTVSAAATTTRSRVQVQIVYNVDLWSSV